MRKVSLIVPCYNEAGRLDASAFRELAQHPEVSLLFVDDGSTDSTADHLGELCLELGEQAALMQLPRNAGKGEAVRAGLRRALENHAEMLVYTDADLAAPVSEVHRLVDVLLAQDLDAVIASRIRHLGSRIDRSPHRHYLGRAFATFASALLRIPIYDTQCGLKGFSRTPALEAALDQPFLSRWCFDVELLARLLIGEPGVPPLEPARIQEIPLREWADVAGSKLGIAAVPAIGIEMVRLVRDVRRRRETVAGRLLDAQAPSHRA